MTSDVIVNTNRIPLAVKLIYTAFVAVLVPVYWTNYGPVNFLYFCDVALLLTVPALWLESGYLASMMAVSIALPQLLWQVDFVTYAIAGKHFPVDLTGYMFDPDLSLFLRGLSFFHFWLPILLVWMVWRLGYVRRALLAQIGLCWIVLLLSYWLTPLPFDKNLGNVNKVYGPSGTAAQTWMHPLLWLGIVMAAMPLAIYVPSHFVLWAVMPEPRDDGGRTEVPRGAEGMFSPTEIAVPARQIKTSAAPVMGTEQKDGRSPV